MHDYNPERAEYQDVYQRAERLVKAKLGFYWHFASYLIVNLFLIIIYLLTTFSLNGSDFGYPWFVWPMAGWGVGLLFHFLGVFVFNDNVSGTIRNKMIADELRKMGAPVSPLNSQDNASGFGAVSDSKQAPFDQ